MHDDDIRSLDDLCAAVATDPRLSGYQLSPQGDGVCELSLGGPGLLLCDASRLPAAHQIETQLSRSRGDGARVVVLGSEDQLRAVADRHADATELSLAVLPMSRARLAVLLPAELDLVTLRRKARERGRVADRYRYELSELFSISRAISSERDVRALLALILERSRYITGADAGSVYVVEGGDGELMRRTLRFTVSQNDSLPVDYREFTLPIDDSSIVGKAALHRQIINIADLYRIDEPGQNPFNLVHNRALDEESGYRTHSMLCLPLINQHQETIGVIQLINRKRDPHARLRAPEDFAEQVIAFDQGSEELAGALASQAGISLDNALLTDEIQQLFEGFVNASVNAIESRDPTTSGHSQRVANLTCRLAEVVDAIDSGPLREVRFTVTDLKQLEYAGLLHDFGKVGVREKVLVKARKLYDHERDLLLLRFDFIRKSIEADALARRLERIGGGAPVPPPAELLDLDDVARSQLQDIDDIVTLLLNANEPTLLDEGSFERIDDIARLQFHDPRGLAHPFLTADEVTSLKVTRGSLTSDERQEIERHVLHTFNFLATIPWGRRFHRIPLIAGTHHEKLDGSGYPWGLREPEIPTEARMMAISDIFDALTASDRPYKRAVPVPGALAILDDEVRAGKCDAELFRVFLEARVWETARRRR